MEVMLQTSDVSKLMNLTWTVMEEDCGGGRVVVDCGGERES